MQTFLPYSSFDKSAKCLDNKRLGKQRPEVWQIYKALMVVNYYGWQNHPAVKMWWGYEGALLLYGIHVCVEWRNRGFKDKMLLQFTNILDMMGTIIFPVWLGNEKFHSSHRAALLYKNYDHYKQFDWEEKPELNYFWPKNNILNHGGFYE